MYKYLLILAILFINFGILSFTQENIISNGILNIEHEIFYLENRVSELIKKKPELVNMKSLKQYHILWLGLGDMKKEDYLDHSFLYHLSQDYYKFGIRNKKKFLKSNTLIVDNNGTLFAKGDARFLHVSSNFDENDIILSEMFFNNELDFAFRISSHSQRYIVGVKGGNLFGIKNTNEGLKIYSWLDFIECCFDEWVFPRKE